jgi:hypothetical protein
MSWLEKIKNLGIFGVISEMQPNQYSGASPNFWRPCEIIKIGPNRRKNAKKIKKIVIDLNYKLQITSLTLKIVW